MKNKIKLLYMSNTLTYSITAPSLTSPINAIMSSSGQITIDINHSNPNFDINNYPNNIKSGYEGINMDSVYPPFSKFTSISYDGNPLILYDANNNVLQNISANYPNVKKIVAGNKKIYPNTIDSNTPSPSPIPSILSTIFLFILISGAIYYFFSQSKSDSPKIGGLFSIGE